MPALRSDPFAEEIMDPPWAPEHADAANREGWNIWNCSGSDYGVWQICRNDEVEELPDGTMPPQLTADDEAWRIVACGTEPHHAAARAFIAAHGDPRHVEELRLAAGAVADPVRAGEGRGQI